MFIQRHFYLHTDTRESVIGLQDHFSYDVITAQRLLSQPNCGL